MLKAILNAIAAIEAVKDENVSEKVVNASRRAQLELLKASALIVRNSLPKRAKLYDGLTLEEKETASRKDGKITAIKLYRDRTKSSLKESKDFVEDWMERNLGFKYWGECSPSTPYLP